MVEVGRFDLKGAIRKITLEVLEENGFMPSKDNAGDLIYREDVLEHYRVTDPGGTFVYCQSILDFVESLPGIPDRGIGHWIGNPRHQACSECHSTYCVPDGYPGTLDLSAYHFCPNCGARMVSEGTRLHITGLEEQHDRDAEETN